MSETETVINIFNNLTPRERLKLLSDLDIRFKLPLLRKKFNCHKCQFGTRVETDYGCSHPESNVEYGCLLCPLED